MLPSFLNDVKLPLSGKIFDKVKVELWRDFRMRIPVVMVATGLRIADNPHMVCLDGPQRVQKTVINLHEGATALKGHSELSEPRVATQKLKDTD